MMGLLPRLSCVSLLSVVSSAVCPYALSTETFGGTITHDSMPPNTSDVEGQIVSRRKRGDTQVMQKLDCQWRCTCSFKTAFSGAVEKMWILTVTSLTHTHGLRNPFGYKIHVKATTEYKIL